MHWKLNFPSPLNHKIAPNHSNNALFKLIFTRSLITVQSTATNRGSQRYYKLVLVWLVLPIVRRTELQVRGVRGDHHHPRTAVSCKWKYAASTGLLMERPGIYLWFCLSLSGSKSFMSTSSWSSGIIGSSLEIPECPENSGPKKIRRLTLEEGL